MTWVEISSVIVTGLAVIGYTATAQRANSTTRNRIYERLDECKVQLEEKISSDYSRKDLCALTHHQIDTQLKEIKEQTALIPKIMAQLQTLITTKPK